MFSLESVVGPVHTCLVLVMFPVFRCVLCIQLPAHLAALDFCHRGQGCSKALLSILYHFHTAASDLHQVDIDLLPQMIVRFWPPSKRACFQPKFSKTLGCKDQQHPP